MKSATNKLSLLFLSTILLFAAPVFAEEYMTTEKIKSVVFGKTFYAKHLIKDFKFKVFFDVDGVTAYRTKEAEVIKTTYKFDGNKHCIFWRGNDRCANILDNGNGTYTRVKNGKHMVDWYKVVQGKDL